MNSQTPIRTLLVDDHELFRAGLRWLLADLPDVEVVAEAADAATGLELAARLGPDLVFVDISMPGMNGIELTEKLLLAAPRTRVIVLSMHASEFHVRRAMQAGAHAYLVKDAAPAELGIAVRAVLAGQHYLSPRASGVMVGGADGSPGGIGVLTPRQREVLQMVALGHSTKLIARALDLSVKTVDTHRAELMRRTGIHDLAGLVRLAIRSGLVTAET